MISRRKLLQTMAATAAAPGAVGRSWAQAAPAKLQPEDVAYQTMPKGDQRCSNCAQFTAPNICAILATRVVPAGWCSVWVIKQT